MTRKRIPPASTGSLREQNRRFGGVGHLLLNSFHRNALARGITCARRTGRHDREPAQRSHWIQAVNLISGRALMIDTVDDGAKGVDRPMENVQTTETVLDDADMAQLDAVSRLPIEYPGCSPSGFERV